MNTQGVTVEPPPGLAQWHQEQGLPAPVRYHVMDVSRVVGVDRN